MFTKGMAKDRKFVKGVIRGLERYDGQGSAQGSVGGPTTFREEKGIGPRRLLKSNFRKGELWRVWLVQKVWFHVFVSFTRSGYLRIVWSIWDHSKKRSAMDFYGELSMFFLNKTIDILKWQLENHKRDMAEFYTYFESEGQYVLPPQYQVALDRIEACWAKHIEMYPPPDGRVRYKTSGFIRDIDIAEKYLLNRIDHASRFETRGYKRFDNDEIRLGLKIFKDEKINSLREPQERGPQVGQENKISISDFIEES